MILSVRGASIRLLILSRYNVRRKGAALHAVNCMEGNGDGISAAE